MKTQGGGGALTLSLATNLSSLIHYISKNGLSGWLTYSLALRRRKVSSTNSFPLHIECHLTSCSSLGFSACINSEVVHIFSKSTFLVTSDLPLRLFLDGHCTNSTSLLAGKGLIRLRMFIFGKRAQGKKYFFFTFGNSSRRSL